MVPKEQEATMIKVTYKFPVTGRIFTRIHDSEEDRLFSVLDEKWLLSKEQVPFILTPAPVEGMLTVRVFDEFKRALRIDVGSKEQMFV